MNFKRKIFILVLAHFGLHILSQFLHFREKFHLSCIIPQTLLKIIKRIFFVVDVLWILFCLNLCNFFLIGKELLIKI